MRLALQTSHFMCQKGQREEVIDRTQNQTNPSTN